MRSFIEPWSVWTPVAVICRIDKILQRVWSMTLINLYICLWSSGSERRFGKSNQHKESSTPAIAMLLCISKKHTYTVKRS